ncbi:hypothetical protein GCM10009734_98240 [Nonomuraea bangladeshensis]
MSVVMLFWVGFLVRVEPGLPYWAGLAMMCCTYLMARLSRYGLRRRWLAGHEFHPDGTSYRHFDGDTRPAS